MLIIDISIAITMINKHSMIKSLIKVNKVMKINNKIDDHIIIVWNTFKSCILLRSNEPPIKPIDLQKNNIEYSVYLCFDRSAKYGINGPIPAIAVAYNINVIQYNK